MTLVLNREEVMSVLDMADCMEAVEKAFAELANGSAVSPLRIPIKAHDGIALYMPAYLKGMGALACKVVTVYKNNPSQYDLPTTIGKVMLQDPKSGNVQCIMDGGYLTAVRTGAASGVATKYLARQAEKMTVGILGTGVQGRTQLWGVSVARSLSRAYVYDVDTDLAERFAREMSVTLGLEIVPVKTPDEVLIADIICTATTSTKPVLDGARVRPGTHLNGVGSHAPDARELDTEIVRRSKFVGDSREACFSEAGDLLIPLAEKVIIRAHFHAELGDIILGRKPGRENDQEITIFKANGLAIQDAAAAKLVYEKAREKHVGTEVDI